MTPTPAGPGNRWEQMLHGFPSFPSGPYDSPAEEWFLHHFTKYLSPRARYADHAPVDTLCGAFVIDYVVTTADRTVGIEIDGREFHDEYRDEWRDAAILEVGAVDTIFRFRAANVFRYPADCIYAISRTDPALIDDVRGKKNLEHLAHEGSRQALLDLNPPSIHFLVNRDEDKPIDEDDPDTYIEREHLEPGQRYRQIAYRGWRAPDSIYIHRRRAEHPRMAAAIAYIRRHGPASIDSLLHRLEKS